MLILFVVARPAGAHAQAPTQSPPLLQGVVLDPMRAPIAGAQVTARADDAALGSSALTNASGRFSLPLDAGHYTVTVTSEGFAPYTETIAIPRGGRAIEVVLQVPGVRESVTVTAPGYRTPAVTTATKTPTPLRDVPQSIAVVTSELVRDQQMLSVADAVRYLPGVSAHQGENNRDQVVMRGNSSSADFFLNGVRDDVQYYRDLYNLDRIEALKGPNAMIFGRGGGGGVINRVTKEAGFDSLGDVTLQAGSYDARRLAADIDRPLTDSIAFRLNGMYENAGSFRQFVGLERYAVNPTFTLRPNGATKITFGYEHLHDRRTADRGITSVHGLPADLPISTYFGNPTDSRVDARVDLASAGIERTVGRLTIRDRALLGDYDRRYQNFVPGAVTSRLDQVTLSAYNNDNARRNLFNQLDLTYRASTAAVRHTLLAGVELGRQESDNFRNTGYFNNAAPSILVPYANPTTSVPVTFRQSATDADNRVQANVAAASAQDQLELTSRVQAIAGIRVDRFDLQYHNNRTGDELRRVDALVSPRLGLVVKPIPVVSIYGSYSVSYLPSSGDQFSSLTTVTEQLEPEQFNNYEVGLKWDLDGSLSVTTAVYRLDRTHTRATDPNDPTRIVQTGSQRTNGYEIGVTGRLAPRWQVVGGYAYQDAFVTSATAVARAGAQVAQVPHHTVSVWNRYQMLPRVGFGLGVVHRTAMYAAIDDTVTLPGYTEADAAMFVTISRRLRVQANVENLFDTRYYLNADSNTNISPGSPRAVRVGLNVAF